MGGAYSTHKGDKNCIQNSVGQPDMKRSISIPWHRCEDNIRTDVMEIWWADVDSVILAQDMDHWRDFVNTVMNLLSREFS
jgi:hypothetical protein